MDLATKVRMVQGQHLGTAHLLGQVVHFHVEAGISGSFPRGSRDQWFISICKQGPVSKSGLQKAARSLETPSGHQEVWVCP